jgi:hypothetical protein
MVDSSKMHNIFAKAARKKQAESKLFLVWLHFAKELKTIKTDFGYESNTRLKESVTKFADAEQEPRSLPPHRGTFDHTICLTAYLKRHRHNRLSSNGYEELKRKCTDLFKQILVRVSNSPYVVRNVMVRKPDGSFGYVSIT